MEFWGEKQRKQHSQAMALRVQSRKEKVDRTMPIALYLDAPFMRDKFYKTHSTFGTSLIHGQEVRVRQQQRCTAKDGVLSTGLEL